MRSPTKPLPAMGVGTSLGVRSVPQQGVVEGDPPPLPVSPKPLAPGFALARVSPVSRNPPPKEPALAKPSPPPRRAKPQCLRGWARCQRVVSAAAREGQHARAV